MIAQNVFFYVIALAMVVAAWRVVSVRNVVHAALWLMVVLGGAAGQFVFLGGDFMVATQILVYLGAILILFIFGIMLTRAPMGKSQDLDNEGKLLPVVVGLLIFGVLGSALWDRFRDEELPAELAPQTTAEVGQAVMGWYVVPMQMIALLLLAALVGAVVVARKD